MNEEMKKRLQYALDMAGKKAVDLSRDLNIPKSAISQYLSGRSKSMPSPRLNAICKYLDVSEAWLMGYDVPMERALKTIEEKPVETANQLADWFINLNTNEDVAMLEEYMKLDEAKKIQVREFVHFLSGRS